MLVSISGSDDRANPISGSLVSEVSPEVVSDEESSEDVTAGVTVTVIVALSVADPEEDSLPAVEAAVVVAEAAVVTSTESVAKVSVTPDEASDSPAVSLPVNFITNMMVPATTMHIPAMRNAVIMVSLRLLLSDTVRLSVNFRIWEVICPRQSYHSFYFFKLNMIFSNRSVIMVGEMRLW